MLDLPPLVAMNAVGVTGTRNGTMPAQRATAKELLLGAWHNGASELHYGYCEGADEELARAAHMIGFKLVAHPPTNKRWWPANPITPDVMIAPEPFLKRDASIVKAIGVLIACPRQREGHEPMIGARGEGTWWTIRHAVKGWVPTWIVWPSGTAERR